jgi:ABC-type amino acid transport substrate-binding protein
MTPAIAKAADLAGKTVAVQTGTSYLDAEEGARRQGGEELPDR